MVRCRVAVESPIGRKDFEGVAFVDDAEVGFEFFTVVAEGEAVADGVEECDATGSLD